MWFKHRAWIPIAWVLSVVNLVAVSFVRPGDSPWHATSHAVLAVVFALGAWRLMARQRADLRPEDSRQTIEDLQQTIEGMQTHLRELEERMDFAERLLAKHRDSERLGGPPR